MTTVEKRNIFVRLLSGFWHFLDESRRAVINILFLFLLFIIITSFFKEKITVVPDGSALVINPAGFIVEQKDYINPVQKAIDDATKSEKPPQTELKDILDAIRNGAGDKRIKMLVIDTNQLMGAGMTKLQAIAEAIQDFKKKSGKPVIANGTFYSQASYLIASQADEVYMDPMGAVVLEGFGRYRTYFKGLLDKLGVNFHIFKVGTFKSAVEPFMRDSMSDKAKEANMRFLSVLWDAYKDDVAKARNLTSDEIENYAVNFAELVKQEKGDNAALALKAKLIDGIKDNLEFTALMVDKVGAGKKGKSYKKVTLNAYIKTIHSPIEIYSDDTNKIALITAKGEILDGEQVEGKIGGKTLAKLIRRARKNENVKAVVLRVDSPGGSAFASEIIRREILATKAAGKKVVVSMGTYAASGGYWISADADQIWARPTTITGSIGIFGMFPTIEKPLNDNGIHRDGVGTTPLAGAFSIASPLSDDVAETIQQIINHGYDNFLEVVANGRHMTKEEVNKIGQGRVWVGVDAKKLGLVDELGNLQDAIHAAAELADLGDDYEVMPIKRKLSEDEKLLQEIFSDAKIDLTGLAAKGSIALNSQHGSNLPLAKVINIASKELDKLANFNDPQGMYANCMCMLDH